jgi:histidyl-tRNA synthetase
MIQAIRGTKDILPENISKWHFVEEKFKKTTQLFGYKELRTPVFEKTEVFHRTIGEATDIVNKEMYTFQDRSGDSITLRPEMTAALVRSLVQNNLLAQTKLQRLWYFGPFFRYERPQKGRQRQFHQFGIECLGSEFPESDVEVILLADVLFKSLGINNYKLIINSLGNENSREQYRLAFLSYLQSVKSELSEDSQNRMDKNPLRILDSKDERDKKILENAPLILDYLDEESKLHFQMVTNALDELKIEYIIDSKLVRGLDYYSHTVFEFQSDYLGSQDSFGGGGRYDGLVEQLGGKPTPAVGFALGVERLLIILEELKIFDDMQNEVDCYIVIRGDEHIVYSLRVASILRNMGLKVLNELNRRSMKAQMREANRSNAHYAIIIGEDEVNENKVVIKNLHDGNQEEIPLIDLKDYKF